MQPRYQKSASRLAGSTNFAIWPLRAWCAARVSRPVAASRSSVAEPLSVIPRAHTAASRANTAL